MEVVCLILGPTKPCSHAFWVWTSLHLLSFLLEIFFIILVIYYDKNWTDTTSCETADNAVSEIENRHHL